ncbi:hypothetical protein [Tenacibaculum finnmarkense]|nr:hypothetical protein [Tenacibaculum finnmarkense]
MIEFNLKKDLKKAEEFAKKYPEIVNGYLTYVKKCEDERKEE